MKLFRCQCGQTVFFENSLCVNCNGELGHCPSCRRIVRLKPHGNGLYRCEEPTCRAWLRKCHNYATHNVCNRCVIAEHPAAFGPVSASALCDCCQLNQTIPDLSVQGNLEKWARLELAKRRVMYGLELIGLDVGRPGNTIEPKLRFDFKADLLPAGGDWGNAADEWGAPHNSGASQRVFTGHLGGTITINIREADDAERERIRVRLGQRYRTLLGHFRHEIAHYFWDVLVAGRDEWNFAGIFGDHCNSDYEAAKQRFYALGPPLEWPSRFVTPYAAMHPWEDWAETFALYLEMHAALDTAANCGLLPPTDVPNGNLPRMLDRFVTLGTALNEMNRTMGLHDWFVRVIPPVLHDKLTYIHRLVRAASNARDVAPAAIAPLFAGA